MTMYLKLNYSMKSDSLLSHLSNLSQLSNLSYIAHKKQYIGSQFFIDSLPFASNKVVQCCDVKQEQIGLDSLGVSLFRGFVPVKQSTNVLASYWTSQLQHNMEGTSDHEDAQQIIKLQPIAKVQYCQQENKRVYDLHIQKQVEESICSSDKMLKNETKNIPKNYGKAIIIFIQKNKQLIQGILTQNGDNYDEILLKLKALKKRINTISDLRNLWQTHTESKSLRIISNYFLRKHSLNYIYNSRIKTRLCHTKYKRRLQQAILNPKDFNYIKNY